jgi:hypothetical protein
MITNTHKFQEAAKHFEKYGYYCAAPPGTFDHKRFWDEETRRCLHGYTVDGVTVTGYHYFYLNYCPILRTVVESYEITEGRIAATKKLAFPAFWDGD